VKATINAKGLEITVLSSGDENDYISLTDIARYKNPEEPKDVVKNWMRSRSTIEFLGLWERLNNSDFKGVEFDSFMTEAGSNAFTLSPKKWISFTHAKGIISKSGRYGGTFAHKDIAFEFASTRESENDLCAIPDTHEIAENPNGQVSCRKKVKSSITRKEASYAEDICPSMVDLHIKVFVETKKNALIIHSKETSGLHRAIEHLPVHPSVKVSMLADHIPFEPMLKLELTDKKTRRFAAFRMCWMGESGWMFLKEGSVFDLVEEFGPHIGQESFYELY